MQATASGAGWRTRTAPRFELRAHEDPHRRRDHARARHAKQHATDDQLELAGVGLGHARQLPGHLDEHAGTIIRRRRADDQEAGASTSA